MNASLRDLQQKLEALETPYVDVDAVVAQGERRLRRRQLAVVASGVAATLAVVVGGTQLTPGSDHSQEPVRPGTTPTPTPSEALLVPEGQVTVAPEIRDSDLSGWTLTGEWTNEGANELSATVDVSNPDHAGPSWYCQGDPDVQIFVEYGDPGGEPFPGNLVTAMGPCDGSNAGSPGSPEGWLSPSGYSYGGDAEQWAVRMMLIDGMPEAQWACFQTGMRTDCETAYPPLQPVESDTADFGFALHEHEAPYVAWLFDEFIPGNWRQVPLSWGFEALSMYNGTEYVFDRIVYASPGEATLALGLDDDGTARLVGAFHLATPGQDRCAERLGLTAFEEHSQMVAACAPVVQIRVDGQSSTPRGDLADMGQWGDPRTLVPPGAHDVTLEVVGNDPGNARLALVIWRVRE